jgi:SHS2 domain-containing protein
MEKQYREFDHSGDVGIEAWGSTPAETLENATLGLFALMVRGGVAARVERELTVESVSDEEMVIDWLSEVIATASTHGEVYGGVRIEQTGPHSVRGVIDGEPIEAGRHELRVEVKAATYHGLVFERTGGGFRVRVIFDL